MSNGIYTGLSNGLADGLKNGLTEGLATGTQLNYDTNTVMPVLLYDFTQIGSYPNGVSSNITDLSGNNNNGIFISGTGNGIPATVSGMTNSVPNYWLQPGSNAIRLPDFCKFPGRTPYTICSWVYPTGNTGGNYPAAFYSSEGRNGPAIGINNAFDFASATKGFLYYRYNGSTGGAQAVGLYPTENGVGVVTYNKWYFTVFRYDGCIMNIDVFIDGKRYNANVLSDASVDTSTSWSALAGLRYNNWFTGRCAYFSIYNKDIGLKEITKLYIRTKTKIGI